MHIPKVVDLREWISEVLPIEEVLLGEEPVGVVRVLVAVVLLLPVWETLPAVSVRPSFPVYSGEIV